MAGFARFVLFCLTALVVDCIAREVRFLFCVLRYFRLDFYIVAVSVGVSEKTI